MAPSLANRLADVHPRNAKCGGETLLRKSEPLPSATVGKCVERALERIGMPVKEAAATLGYADPGIFYRWFCGREVPNLERLWTLGSMFQRALIIELATASRTGRVTTLVEFDELAVSL